MKEFDKLKSEIIQDLSVMETEILISCDKLYIMAQELNEVAQKLSANSKKTNDE